MKINKEKLVFEIGDIISVRRKFWSRKLLTPKEIMKSFEYEQFKKKCPYICEIAESMEIEK